MLQALPQLESIFFSVFLILSLALVVMVQHQHILFSSDLIIDLMLTSEAATGLFYSPRSLKASLKSSVSQG